MRKLFLDDVRAVPPGWDVVRTYDAFVSYIEREGMPDVISFDHDLGIEHYPKTSDDYTKAIDYAAYTEKTGFHCAEWVLAQKTRPELVIVHSFNPVGTRNISKLFIAAGITCLILPYRVPFPTIIEE